MDAKVTVEYIVKNACGEDISPFESFEELIRWLIKEEGIYGISEDDYRIVRIEKCFTSK
jgi:hypothetical protein